MKETSPFLQHGLISLLLAGCTGAVGGPGGSGRMGLSDEAASGEGGAGGAGGSVDSPAPICDGTPSVAAGKWRRLTTPQYRNTIQDLLGIDADVSTFLADSRSGAFATNTHLPPQANDIDQYRSAAEKAASQAVVATRLATTLACDTKTQGEDACARQFIARFGARAYRRPLTSDESASFIALYTLGKQESFATGIGLVIETALQSPNFLYLPEFGVEDGSGLLRLSGHELAARLSFLLWNTSPDQELIAAADKGQLADPAGVRSQAERLLASPRFIAVATSFHAQLLGVEGLQRPGSVTKNATLFPEFNQDMRNAMAEETRRFVEYAFAQRDGTIETMLTAPYSFATGPLLKLYELTATAPPADGRYENKDGTRLGLLTQAGFLAAHPATQSLFPAVARGKAIRFHLLCSELPAPPAAANFEPPADADRLTQQELMRRHQDDPSCAPCHVLMEPIGFGLDNYDAIGRYRTTAPDGSVVDASGDIAATDVEGPFTGVAELAERLARSQDVRTCMAEQWFKYTLGRAPGTADECALADLTQVLKEGRGDIGRGLLAFVTSDAFRFRKGE